MRELRAEGVKYKILQCLGEGETAAVYRADREDSQGHSRQTVALKILKDRTAVSRMRTEFEALTRVNSPYCVRLLAWENLPEGAALVLEWVDGISLLQLARRRSLSHEARMELLAQIQYGLRAIHELGLVHGDLSPSNVMIDRKGCVRLLDFSMPSTNPKELRGTPAFLAPEVWQGQASTQSSDLFSLGLIVNDLSQGFSSSPHVVVECRERALKMAVENSGLLAREPEKRRLQSIESCLAEKSKLGLLVSSILDERGSASMRTQPLASLVGEAPVEPAASDKSAISVMNEASIKKDFASAFSKSNEEKRGPWLRQYAVAACLAIVATTAPVAADAPAASDRSEGGAIEIRTERWLEIWINGKSLGFAPLFITQVKAGSHRIRWQGSGGGGESRITLQPGARLVLDEKALRLGQSLRNH